MSIFAVGRLCIKIAGRDSNRQCVVVEQIDDRFVVVDGNVRRKKVNVKHLEPLSKTVEIKDKASHEDVKKAFDKLGLPVWEKKSKKPAERPKKQKKIAKKKPVDEKKAKKAAKKEAEKEETPKKEEKLEEKEVKEEPKEEAKVESVKEEKPKKEEVPNPTPTQQQEQSSPNS